MRRKEKEITDQIILESILKKAKICRLGILDKEKPYIIPVNYGYHEGHLYIHSASEGKKITLLKKNPNICFEIEGNHKIQKTGIPCNWSTTYQSIIGYGTATILTNENEKRNALHILINHYSPDTNYDFSKNNVDAVSIIKIKIEKMTGKQSI
jgi:nitroimidazol reductase NimA-like FMN-containing flavoprotein (pyridoxamine 5'-phosphate oxidase superfamily)